jgi:hypothetical protein
MRKSVFLLAMVAGVVLICGMAFAEPKYVGVSPSLSGDTITLSPFPAGATLLNVVVWDDPNGTPGSKLGPQMSFTLKPGQGFNFLWKDQAGNVWWQMIKPTDVAPRGLYIDDSYKEDGVAKCKWTRPLPHKAKK